MIYLLGKGFTRDYSKSLEWFRKAADQNLPESQFQVGTFYHYGRVVTKDYVAAREWCLKGVGQGFKEGHKDLQDLEELIRKEGKNKKKSSSSKLKFW